MSRVAHLESCGRKRNDDYSDCDRRYDLHNNDDHAAHEQCIKRANEEFDRCVQQAPQEHGVEADSSNLTMLFLLLVVGYLAVAFTTKKPLIVA